MFYIEPFYTNWCQLPILNVTKVLSMHNCLDLKYWEPKQQNELSYSNIQTNSCLFNSLHILGNFACFFVICWVLKNFFENFFHEYHQIVKQFVSRSGPTFKMSGLIWVQTVCQGYQQTTLVGKDLRISS